MQIAHPTTHATPRQSLPASICYDDWRPQLQAASDMVAVVQVVRAYLQAWQVRELAMLPHDLGATALMNAEDIPARAVLAHRAEATFEGTQHQRMLLREMSLMMAAAANRMRQVGSPRVSARQ